MVLVKFINLYIIRSEKKSFKCTRIFSQLDIKSKKLGPEHQIIIHSPRPSFFILTAIELKIRVHVKEKISDRLVYNFIDFINTINRYFDFYNFIPCKFFVHPKFIGDFKMNF